MSRRPNFVVIFWTIPDGLIFGPLGKQRILPPMWKIWPRGGVATTSFTCRRRSVRGRGLRC